MKTKQKEFQKQVYGQDYYWYWLCVMPMVSAVFPIFEGFAGQAYAQPASDDFANATFTKFTSFRR